jgi:single-strand DNA-binding protein
MQINLNHIVLIGRLTRDPELRALPTGDSVCEIRLAVSGAGPKGAAGFFNISVYGTPGENCLKYLAKGSKVAVDGRLCWREWEADHGKREAISVRADRVEFLTPRSDEQDQDAETTEAVTV